MMRLDAAPVGWQRRWTVLAAFPLLALASALPAAAQPVDGPLCAQAALIRNAAVECRHDAAGQPSLPAELSPRQVWALKQQFGARIVLIDVRMPVETVATGSAQVTDHVIPVRIAPAGMDDSKPLPSSKLVDDPRFIENVAQTLRISGVPRGTPIVVLCRTANRSAVAVKKLRAAGYDNVSDLIGGMDGKSNALDDDEMGWRASRLPISRFVDPPI
jgi:rhodanese-related sulfurtransferase